MAAFDDPRLWARIEPILDEVLDLGPEDRAACLDRRCAGDAALRAAVEQFLEAADRRSPLDRSLPDLAATFSEHAGEGLAEPRSRRVGAWQLLELIGTGGMGRVYRAARREGGFEQTCALKLLRWDMASSALVQRFATERQILADLQHPGIARLVDGGVSDEGLPYLVMEFVEGRPIDVVAAELPVRARLELFLDVCDAVQHAHRRLVVHRDLKPSNILVTEAGEVKLLDFGVAKILDAQAGTHPATLTHQALATPLYAAPEQLDARSRAVTTATDVWALGVLLYRILTGRTPFGDESSGLTQLVQQILGQDPAAPSASAAQDRGQLRGDLDTIVLKALEKEPERRYGSVEGLAADVRRHLHGEPITARPTTMAYRSRKFLRRHRGSVGATGVVLVLLATLVVFYTDRLATERDRARQEALTTEQVKSFVLSMFESSDPGISQGEDITARQLLDRGAERIPAELRGQPLIEAEMHDVVAGLYSQLGLYEESDAHFRQAVELRRAQRDPSTPELAQSLSRWGYTLQELGEYEQAEVVLREGLSLLRREAGEARHLASATNQLGMFLAYKGDYEEAEALLRESAETYERLEGVDSPWRATAVSNLGLAVKWSGRLDEAEPYYREALRIRRAAFGADHPDVAVTLDNLGVLLGQRGDYESSEACFREALEIRRRLLGDEHPDVALNLNNLATLFRVQGRLDEAEPIYLQVLEMNRRTLGPDHPRVATNVVNLGSVQLSRGSVESAIASFEEGLRIRRAALGDEHVEVANALTHLVRAYVQGERVDEAVAPAAESVRVTRAAVGDDGYQLANALFVQADVEWRRQRFARAKDVASEALRIQRAHLDPQHVEIAASEGLIGACMVELGDLEEAEARLVRAHESLARQGGADAADVQRTREALVELYRRTGREDRASALEQVMTEESGP